MCLALHAAEHEAKYKSESEYELIMGSNVTYEESNVTHDDSCETQICTVQVHYLSFRQQAWWRLSAITESNEPRHYYTTDEPMSCVQPRTPGDLICFVLMF
jgi:hypothetical protein